MKILQLISLVISVIFLLSCSHDETETTPTTVPNYQWTCDTGTIVEWKAEDLTANKIQLRLDNGQKLYILNKIYTTDIGTLYSNGELAFRVKNQTGEIFWAGNDEIIGQNCR
ncbi:hypothetical protein [Entomomonas asaccharolytica]|uniref:C-type lysozyme inhibitor domain-containing protein n=1 Tax=Entomomonas asaccharolytica TaxID=2785331 RepID=A0A974NGA9_9GAMM|nr:hypothetical protein [Entomomonas asaccharolytica]QQP85962.1 hypothetical protein JHT90_01500 [Entomomonas asaccharolytica]